MKKTMSIAFLSLAQVILTSSMAAAAASNATLESYAKGYLTVKESLSALDATGKFKAATGLRLDLEGKSYQRNQGALPDGPPAETNVAWTELFDLAGNRWSWHQRKEIGGGFRFDARIASTPSKSFIANVLTKEWSAFTPPANPDFPYHAVPTLILQRALEQRQSLRWRARESWEGRAQDVVDFAWNATTGLTLYIDSATKLLSKFDLVQAHSAEGDDTLEGIFSDYRDVDGVRFPARYTERQAGKTTLAFRYSQVKLNPQGVGDEAFTVPPDFTERNRTPHLTTIADKVFLLEDLNGLYFYNVLFVEIDNGVVVFDAPLGSEVSRQVIERIHETLPGKPIRYLIISHYHDDHTAGIRPYVAEGATIITTRGNQPFLEKLAAVRPTLAPEGEPGTAKIPRFRFVDDDDEIRDGQHSIRIYRIGPFGHVAEMLFVYLPVERLIHQADLYSDFVPINDSMAWFYRKLQDLALPAERMSGVHMPLWPFSRYDAALRAYVARK